MDLTKRLLRRVVEATSIFVVFVLIGVTYFAVSHLSAVGVQYAQNGNAGQNQVLGAKTTSTIFYYPLDTKQFSFIKDTELALNTENQNNARFTINFNSIDTTTYEVPLIQIKNPAETPAKIKISPSYSLQNTGISLTANINGVTIPLIEKNGQITIPEVQLDPQSITPMTLIISSQYKVVPQSSLMLDIIRF